MKTIYFQNHLNQFFFNTKISPDDTIITRKYKNFKKYTIATFAKQKNKHLVNQTIKVLTNQIFHISNANVVA